MKNARATALRELEQLLRDVGMKPTTFAKRAGVQPSTLNKFLANEDHPVLGTSTLTKLRAARDQIVSERSAAPLLQHLTKHAKKRALIAALLEMSDDHLITVEQAIQSIPESPPAGGEDDDVAS